MPTSDFGRVLDLGGDGPRADFPATITSSKTGRAYDLSSHLKSGSVADLYDCDDAVVKVAKKGANALFENEALALEHIFTRYGTLPERAEDIFASYFPKLLDSFVVEGRRVHVFQKLKDYYSLEQLRDVAGKLKFEHAVWILNRILEGLDFLNVGRRLIHGAILPPHVMVFASDEVGHSQTHRARLIDYTCSVPRAAGMAEDLNSDSDSQYRITFVSSKWKKFYPPEVFEKRPARPAMDIYMAVKCAIYILGGNPETNEMPSEVPDYLRNFLRACVTEKTEQRPKDAWKLHEELAGLMLRNYGPKTYHPFHISELRRRATSG